MSGADVDVDFANNIVDLAYDNFAQSDLGQEALVKAKRAYATALQSLYERHEVVGSWGYQRRLRDLASGEAIVGVCTADALRAGITKLEIQAIARLCFTPEGKS